MQSIVMETYPIDDFHFRIHPSLDHMGIQTNNTNLCRLICPTCSILDVFYVPSVVLTYSPTATSTPEMISSCCFRYCFFTVLELLYRITVRHSQLQLYACYHCFCKTAFKLPSCCHGYQSYCTIFRLLQAFEIIVLQSYSANLLKRRESYHLNFRMQTEQISSMMNCFSYDSVFSKGVNGYPTTGKYQIEPLFSKQVGEFSRQRFSKAKYSMECRQQSGL